VKAQTLLPPGKMDENELVRFVKDHAYRSSPLWADDHSRWRKAELYDQGDQWLRRASTTRDSRYPSQWIRMEWDTNDPTSIPLPVYNEGGSIRENESARLGRPEYKPRVRPRSENPGLTEKEGAKGAEHALKYRLKVMPDDVVQDRITYNMPVYGGAWLLSYWDQDWLETVRVPAPAMACPRHPSFMPSMEEQPQGPVPTNGQQGIEAFVEQTTVQQNGGLPVTSMETGVEPVQSCPFVAREADLKEKVCPSCEDHPDLMPYRPSMDEAQGALGMDWPKGDWKIVVPWPYEIYARDAGVGVDPSDVDEFVYVHKETLDWVAARYPDKVRDDKGQLRIRSESPAALMAEDPTFGAPDVFKDAHNTGAFKNHVIVYDYFRKPWLEWNDDHKQYVKNQGRCVTVVQNTVCLDDVLMVESLNEPGRRVQKARLEYIWWELREGGRRATSGQSLWDRMFDAQDGINEREAQVRSVNQRGAVPWYLQARGRNFETRAADSAVPFRRVMVDIEPNDKQPPLTLMQNTTINPGVYQEIGDAREYLSRVSGQVEVERGQVPPGVSAATAIAYLKTESGEKRRPRIKRIKEALVRAWDHGLQLMAAFYIEDRPYEFEDEYGEERWAFIHGKVIAEANPQVDIYPTPDYDQADAEREAIRDMVQLGILDPNKTSQVNRKIVKTLQPSLEFFVDDDLQEEQAQREWRDFKERRRIPVIDPSLDDHPTHYEEHGRSCFQPSFRQKEDAANWDGALNVLGADWDRMAVMVGLQRPPGTSLQTLLYTVWKQELEKAQFQSQDQDALEFCLHWRAHREAHKLEMLLPQIRQQQAQAPATGSSPTPQNEEPQPGAEMGGPPPPGPM